LVYPQATEQVRRVALGVALMVVTGSPVWGQTATASEISFNAEDRLPFGNFQNSQFNLPSSSSNSFEPETPIFKAQTLQTGRWQPFRQLLEQLLAGEGRTAELEQAIRLILPQLEQMLDDEESDLDPEVEQELKRLRSLVEQILESAEGTLNPNLREQLATVRQSIVQIQTNNNDLKLDPEIIENSPVLQRWLQEIPDVLADIHNDPAFKTRVRLGYSQYPSTNEKGGFNVGVEDILIGRTGLTASINYDRVFEGDRQTFGADLQYYLFPLGSYANVAPVIGYRNITTDGYWTDGPSVGVRAIFPLSRTGAADITLSQLFVSPGSRDEVGITTFSVGYAVTPNLRLAADIQKQNSIGEKDSRVGLVLEWMP